ncbi:hypothetical protein NliqN6_4225 [Naganishia liquefaciens]|uniref:cAMP-independent regulatory protein pac2 n=1 Tax=Naganishia liquefaciens TaxID=104408 RepID=A0A8H3TVG2_9TREE|nr:hypothetical protein NliqN6_4225 [Naganishia liquefaciens]
MQASVHIGVKQEASGSPSWNPKGQQPISDNPVQHRFIAPNSHHINGDQIDYVGMQSNYFTPPLSAPLPQLIIKPVKYEPFAQSGAVEPPFRGYCENTHDALILFEAAKRGIIPRVTRRLTDREKAAMIKSGAVFVFDEHESNIKRWTDGMSWSPSRIYGNYLTYREIVDKAEALATANAAGIPSGDISGATPNSLSKPYPRNPLPGTARNRPHLSAASVSGLEAPGSDGHASRSASDVQSQAVNGKKGSQSAKNFWRPNGLVKRTISVLVNGYHQHLVSYYNPTDVHEDRLYRPRDVPLLAELEIGDEYLRSDSFRLPIQTTVTAEGKLIYVGEPSNVPGQANSQIQPEAVPLHPTMPAPPSTAPMRQQTVYNVSPQGYAFASVPQEVVLDPTSHSRPSTGTSHGSVITPMSPITGGNYYENYLEQEQQKAMVNTAPVGWQVPLPKQVPRPHTTQFGGGTTMTRQVSEGTGRDHISSRLRATSRYQPYGSPAASPDQAHFPQNAVQLVLPSPTVRSAGMHRTPSYQNGQAHFVPMTSVVEVVGNNHVLVDPTSNSYEMQPSKMQPSPPQNVERTPHGPNEVSTPQYSPTSFQQNASTPKSAGMASNSHHVRTISNSYAPTDDSSIANHASGVNSNIAWAGMSSSPASAQYLSAPIVKTEHMDSAPDSAEMTRSYSGPATSAMNAYPPQMTAQYTNHPNGVYPITNTNQQWMMPMMPQDTQRTMLPPSYHQPTFMNMGPSQVVPSGWQSAMPTAYPETQPQPPIQAVYFNPMPGFPQ